MSAATLPGPKRRKEYKVRYDEYGDIILPGSAEFVDGRIVLKRRNRGSAMSELSHWVGNQLWLELNRFVDQQKIGLVFRGSEDLGYQCFPEKPNQVRKPDVSFLRRDMSKFFLRSHGWIPEVPELIVEVVSPEDKFLNIDARIADFIDAGTKLLWVVNPFLETAEIIHPDGRRQFIRNDGILDGEDVLPGFKLPLSSILPPKPKTT